MRYLELYINGELAHSYQFEDKNRHKPGASTIDDKYHHAMTILRRIAGRQSKPWEIHLVYRAMPKNRLKMPKNDISAKQHNRVIAEYTNTDHIMKALTY